MSDRELLELAAKAARSAGANIIDSEAGPQIFERYSSDGWECYRLWIPHKDDGDALRLATRLHIDLVFYNGFVETTWIDEALGETQTVVEFCDEEIDGRAAKEAATRLAIVRAAAEIARAAA